LINRMPSLSASVIVLPGANSRPPDLAVFGADPASSTRFEVISYPEWRRYFADGFSAEVLIADLASQIATRVPLAPIHIIGISIGGHFGYAAALRLQASGREIAGFCAIDSFMVDSSELSAGWKGRALALSWRLLRERRIKDLSIFVRSRFWRALFRLARDRLPSLLSVFAASGQLPAFLASSSVFEAELNMRLLIREMAPWIGLLDRNPVALNAPAILLRTTESAGDDAAWRGRCPGIEIFEIPGKHQTIFEPENLTAVHRSFVAATRAWKVAAED
jgi:thioesterase domain-containing protein